MLINEVCKECALTKKAVEYYIGQGLIAPAVQENGYRDFSEEDVYRLKKISVLRSLGLSVADIRNVLSGRDTAALQELYHKRRLQMTALQEKQELIRELAEKQDWEHIQNRLLQLQKKQTVLERLTDSFPGYYGRFLCLHFAPYLKEPVLSQKQQEAFDTIISFLDRVDFDISDDLKKYLDELIVGLNEEMIQGISAGVNTAIREMGNYMTEKQEEIERYFAYKQSEEYKATPAYRLETELRRFNSTSGYNDIFIPAMCQLSESYRKYQEALRKADEELMQRYPDLEEYFSEREENG